MAPENGKKQKAKNPNPVKRAWGAVRAKNNRRLVGSGIALVAVSTALAITVVTGGKDDQTPVAEPEPQTQVTVTPTETPGAPAPEAPDSTPEGSAPSSTTDRNVISEAPTQEPQSENEEDYTPEDFPPGNPASRGGLPIEFPLIDSYTYTGMEEQEDRIIINGTVDDPNLALWTLDANLMPEYMVTFRKVDTARTSGSYKVEGPQLPEGTQVVVTSGGDFTVRVPQSR